MKQTSPKRRFREAMLAENGMSISAGARVSHVRTAIEAGRVMTVDLSAVPEEKRPEVVAEIKQLIERASVQSPRKNFSPKSAKK